MGAGKRAPVYPQLFKKGTGNGEKRKNSLAALDEKCYNNKQSVFEKRG